LRFQQGQVDDLFGELLQISHSSVLSRMLFQRRGLCGLDGTGLPQAASRSSSVERIPAMLLAGAPIAPAMLLAGAPMQDTIEAISSSRDGIWATAFTPAGSRAFSPIAPPRITNLSFVLA